MKSKEEFGTSLRENRIQQKYNADTIKYIAKIKCPNHELTKNISQSNFFHLRGR